MPAVPDSVLKERAMPAVPESGVLCQTDCVRSESVSRTLGLLEQAPVYRDLAELFGALADSTRVKIVHALLHQELCSCDLASAVGISKSGASQHLRVLRSLHLVKSRRSGKFVYYSLDDAHIALLLQIGLTHLGHGEAGDVQRIPATAGGVGVR